MSGKKRMKAEVRGQRSEDRGQGSEVGCQGSAVKEIAGGSDLLAVNREVSGILGGDKRPGAVPLSDEERRAYKMALILVCVETQTMQGTLMRTGEDVKRVFGGGWAVVEKRILRDIGARGMTAMETNAAAKMMLRELAETPEAVEPGYARDTVRTVRERWGAEVREACGCWGGEERSEVGGQRSEGGVSRGSTVGAVRGGPGEKTVGGEGDRTNGTNGTDGKGGGE